MECLILPWVVRNGKRDKDETTEKLHDESSRRKTDGRFNNA